MAELVVDTIVDQEYGYGGSGAVRVLRAPFAGGELEAEAGTRVGGATSPDGMYSYESVPHIIEDHTGDSLPDLVLGPELYSGFGAGVIEADEAYLVAPVPLYRPCSVDGHQGFCSVLGFWSPDGAEVLFNPQLGPTPMGLGETFGHLDLLAVDVADGVELWTLDGQDRPLRVTLRSVDDAVVDPGVLDAESWDSPEVIRFDRVADDLTGDGKPDIIGGYQTAGSTSAIVAVFVGLKVEGASLTATVRVELDGLGLGTLAVGDFDGDGSADLAVGRSTDEVKSVLVFRGPLAGLLTEADADREIVLAGPDAPENGRFGGSLAVSDFDGDGRDDLAIGEPGFVAPDGPSAGRTWISWGAELD